MPSPCRRCATAAPPSSSAGRDFNPANGHGGPADNGGSDRGAERAAPQTASGTTHVRTPTKGVVVVTNARIFPIATPAIERGSIVIRDGIIESVGANLVVPAGAQVIDVAGADVYPGFINARSTIGLADPGAGGFSDADEILDFNPQLRPQVAFHNDSDAIPVARANGVTTAAVTPSGGILGGQVAVMDLDGYTWEESTVRTAVGVTFQFPSIGGGGRGAAFAAPAGPPRPYEEMKRERDARLDAVARLLEEARAYAKAAGPNRETNWQLEALVPVVEKRIPFITRRIGQRRPATIPRSSTPPPARARSATSTASAASCAIAATRSRSWRRRAAFSRPRT